MVDDVPEAEKVRRHQALEALQEEICAEINARQLGQTVEVLVEELHKGKWRGRTRQNKLVFIDSRPAPARAPSRSRNCLDRAVEYARALCA